MTIRRRSLAQTLVGGALVLGMTVAVAPPGVSATESVRPFAGTGTVTGQITPAPAGARFEPVVRASRLDVAGPATSTVANAAGRYRLRLPVGLWAVTAPSWTSGRLAYVTKVVPVGAGKSTMLRSRPAETLARAPIRLSSGPWKASGAFPDDLNAQLVSSAYQDVVASDLVSALNSACSASRPEAIEVGFRGPGGHFADIMREVKVGMSKYADAEFRALAKKALRSLKANAPTHTVTGDVTFTDVGGRLVQTVTARVTEDKTGLVTWQKEYSGPADGDFYFNVTEELSRDIATRLCGTPLGLHISATATVRAEDDDASGTARLKVEYDVWSRPDEPYLYWVDAPVTWTVAGSTFSGKGSCPKTSTGTTSSTESVFVGQGAAALNRTDGTVKVFIGSSVATTWQETPPPDECTADGALLLLFNVVNLAVPLGGTASATGSTHPGVTYDVTATVTPIVSRP